MKRAATLLLFVLTFGITYGQQATHRYTLSKKPSRWFTPFPETSKFLKSAELVRPENGKQWGPYNENAGRWMDSTDFAMTYTPEGKVATRTESDMLTYELENKYEYAYDEKGYLDVMRSYISTPFGWLLQSEYAFIKKYDSQGRLVYFCNYYGSAAGDSTDAARGYIKYTADTASMVVKVKNSGIPNEVVESDLFTRKNGSSTYNYGTVSSYNGTGYDLQTYSNIEWNGEFSFLGLLGVDGRRILFKKTDYTFNEGGVITTGRITGTVAPKKETELNETKVGPLYTPQDLITYIIDDYGNVESELEESVYDPITKTYSDQDNLHHDYTYNAENIQRDYQEESHGGDPTPYLLIVYADFKNLNSIRETGAVQRITVSPNPAASTVSFTTDDEVTAIYATDVTGKKTALFYTTNNGSVSVDVNALGNGMYTLSAAGRTVTFRAQLVVNH